MDGGAWWAASGVAQSRTGRQRRKDNPFREIVHIFYKDNKRIVTDDEFRDSQEQKMEKSKKQISIWKTADVSCKTIALENLANLISSNPNEYYLTTTNGVPEINNLIVMSEMYCRDILRDHHQWFVVHSNNYGRSYSMPVQKLKDELCMSRNKAWRCPIQDCGYRLPAAQ